MFSILKPFIFTLDPEVAHDLAINSLKLNVLPKNLFKVDDEELLETKLFNQSLPNPIGLAAGFDKSAEVYNSLFKLGYGFVEVGTVTPKRQLGNPKPRVFRLEKDQALINRLGFNNHGSEIVSKRILENIPNGFLGINVGPNKDTKNKEEDYYLCLSKLHSCAGYLTINISSPNTEGLRDLQLRGKIEKLIKKIIDKRDEIKNINTKPILIKISPDLNEDQLRDIALISLANNIDGLILTNSTIKRYDNLISINKEKKGGLSGKPLYDNSNIILKKMYELTNGQIPLIGVGGISSGRDCYEKIKSGASLVQLYTALVYSGPNLINSMKGDLIDLIKTDGYKNVSEVIGKSV